MDKNSILLTQPNLDDLKHVFIVVNPVTVILSRMIIDNFKLNRNDIIIISTRNTDLTLLNFNSLKYIPKKYDSLFDKFFFKSTLGKKILKKLQRRQFIVYSSWATRELNYLMTAKNCLGHYYIEEGQATYMEHIPFSHKKIPLIDKLKNNFKNRINENDGSGYFFRDDALGYIGLSIKSFPKINNSKKIILNNINELKDHYKPKLVGIKTIGLTCAERRLKDNNWEKMLKIIVDELPVNSAIKAQLTFTLSQKRFNILKGILNEISDKKIILCENDVILELEMLYEKKNFLGPQTSVSIYAELFESSFENLKLY